MEFKHLEAFLLAVELGSISAAARKLGKPQSLTSQWMSDLETDLNLQLFQRTGNKTRPTEKALALVPQISVILSNADKLQLSAEMLAAGEPNRVSLLIDEWIPQLPVAHAISLFSKQNPGINLEVVALPRKEILKATQETPHCLGLISELEYHHFALEYERIGFYQDVLVSAPSFPLASESAIKTSALASFRELVWSSDTEEFENEGFGQHCTVISDFQLLIALLQAGDSYALLHEHSVAELIKQEKLVVLDVQHESVPMHRRVELIWSLGSQHSTVMQQLKESVLQHHQFQLDKPE